MLEFFSLFPSPDNALVTYPDYAQKDYFHNIYFVHQLQA